MFFVNVTALTVSLICMVVFPMVWFVDLNICIFESLTDIFVCQYYWPITDISVLDVVWTEDVVPCTDYKAH